MILLFCLIDSTAVINAPLAKLKYLNLSSCFIFFEKMALKVTIGLSVDDVCINIKIFSLIIVVNLITNILIYLTNLLKIIFKKVIGELKKEEIKYFTEII